MARRWWMAVSLVGLSVLYIAGAFAYAQSVSSALAAAPDVLRFLEEARVAYLATWGWVIGAPVVHALVAGVAARRGDREALAGVTASLVLQIGLAVAFGVVSPPTGA
ncbi:MAG: hypothetical protein RLZZ383_1747 [Pseudomonadota bacterium]